MPLLPKEVIRPGKYHTQEGVVMVTPERIKRWAKMFHAMKGRGLLVPVPNEHQDDAYPMDDAERLARDVTHNAGFGDDMWVEPDGSLWTMLDIPDAEAAEHAVKSVRFVSPEIEEDFTDGTGKKWRDVITHMALTPRPVWAKQKPFGTRPPSGRLSRARGRVVRLSMSRMGCGSKGVRKMGLEEENVDKSGDDEAVTAGLSEGDALEEATDPAEAAATMPQTPEDFMRECVEMLPDCGIHLPPHTTPETFFRDLAVALHAVKGHKEQMSLDEAAATVKDDEEDEDEDEDDELDDDELEQEEPSSLLMSLNKRVRDLQEDKGSLVAERAELRLSQYERDGRISPADAKALRTHISRRRMSLGKGGAEVKRLSATLDMIGRNPKGTFAPARKAKVGLSQAQRPGVRQEKRRESFEPSVPVTRERAEAAAAEQLKASGIR